MHPVHVKPLENYLAPYHLVGQELWFSGDCPVVPSKSSVFVLPGEARALVGERRSDHPLYVVRHLVARLSGTGANLVQESTS